MIFAACFSYCNVKAPYTEKKFRFSLFNGRIRRFWKNHAAKINKPLQKHPKNSVLPLFLVLFGGYFNGRIWKSHGQKWGPKWAPPEHPQNTSIGGFTLEKWFFIDFWFFRVRFFHGYGFFPRNWPPAVLAHFLVIFGHFWGSKRGIFSV